MKKIENYLQYIGIYQIVGGLIGLLPFIRSFLKLEGYESIIWLLSLLILGCAHLFSIYCGYLLISKKYNRGINFSIINQAIQVIGFSVFGFGFKLVSGLFLGIKIDLTNDIFFLFEFDWSHWKFHLNSNSELTFLSINIVPIIILNLLFKWKDKMEQISKIEAV